MSLRKPLVSIVILCLAALGAEMGFASIGPSLGVDYEKVEGLRSFLSEGHRTFEPFPYSGFVAHVTPEQEGDVTRPKKWSFEPKKTGRVRIACLGGSTTHGKYPRIMKQVLDQKLGEPVEVMNWGVPGWTTQETMVNYMTTVQDYDPDVVVIHHALNDVAPRRMSDFRSDYAHWRKTWEDPHFTDFQQWLIQKSDIYAGLVAKTTPAFILANFANRDFEGIKSDAPARKMPAGTEVAFRRNIETLCDLIELRGGKVCLVTMPYKLNLANRQDGGQRLWAAGIEEHNQILRDISAERDLLLVDCEAGAKIKPEVSIPMFRDRVHLTWKGARVKATAIADGLLKAGWVE